MNGQTGWTQYVEKVPCPRCGAGVDEKCRSATNPRAIPHRDRSAPIRAAYWAGRLDSTNPPAIPKGA